MSLTRNLGNLAGLTSLVLATSFLSPKTTEADTESGWKNGRISGRVGINLPTNQYGRNFTPGAAGSIDYLISEPWGSLGLGTSLLQANGRHSESTTRTVFFGTDEDEFDEDLYEFTIQGEALIHIRPYSNSGPYSGSFFFGAGLRQNIIFVSEFTKDEEYNETSEETIRSVIDTPLGFHGVVGFDVPLGENHFGYIRVEPRFTFESEGSDYKGTTVYVGVHFALPEPK